MKRGIRFLGYDGFIALLGSREHTISTEEKNKALVCQFLEAHSKADLETLEELLAPEFVDHSLLLPAMTQGTRDSYTQ